jgi:hypothetical protein
MEERVNNFDVPTISSTTSLVSLSALAAPLNSNIQKMQGKEGEKEKDQK